MPKTRIAFDRGPVLLAGGGILRLSLTTNRHGRPTLWIDHTGEISLEIESEVMAKRPRQQVPPEFRLLKR